MSRISTMLNDEDFPLYLTVGIFTLLGLAFLIIAPKFVLFVTAVIVVLCVGFLGCYYLGKFMVNYYRRFRKELKEVDIEW